MINKHNHNQHNHHHSDHDHHHHGDFKKIFFISLPLGLFIMWISPIMGLNIPFPFQNTFKYSDILALILSTILMIYGGKPFFTGAIDEFKQKKPAMMALVSMGLSVSYLYSIYAIVVRYTNNATNMDFLFELASLILIMLLGHWIEMLALGKAGDAKESLAALIPSNAKLITKEGIKQVTISELKVGDIIQVQAGENIAADGVILKGESRINESLLTGESVPVSKQVGDQVIGGSTNEYGVLEVKVTKTGKDSFLSQVQDLVDNALNQPSRAEDLANKVASYLFYIALLAAILSFTIWTIFKGVDSGINYAITTLVIACPHALGLAIPLVVSRSTSIGAKEGLLVKNRDVYHKTTKASFMILDKTGTLTIGDFEVRKIEVLDKSYKLDEIISLLHGIELGSTHPIATSIISYAESKNIKPFKFDTIEVLAGKGILGLSKNDEYKLISQKSLDHELTIEDSLGATVSVLTKNNNVLAYILLGDEIKNSSYHLIEVLNSRNIKPIMATGDNENAAKAVADKLNIDYYFDQSPEDKYNLVEKLKNNGNTVIMVGDGINDAPPLALADIGVAVGAGTRVAIDSADVILTNSEPGDIESFIDLSYSTNNKMIQNLIWGAGYNFIAIPLAAGLLAPIGFTISPALGAILMSMSTVIVALNAMLLRLKKR